MTRKLDWKWIGNGVLVMVVLNIAANLVLTLLLPAQMRGTTGVEDIDLSSGHLALVAAVSFLSFAIGGFIVGLKSAGRTIIESGISAAIAVPIALLISRNFTAINLLAGALLPFLAGVLGGWIGERRQRKGTA
jgi:ABC-type dipeptide/oligopeptide/nickel transport system permease subunit